MKIIMRLATTTFLLLVTIATFGYFFWYKPKAKVEKSNPVKLMSKTLVKNNAVSLSISPMGLKRYLKAHNFNTTHCFLIYMKIPSNNKRFFVYNVVKDSVEFSGLVTHGSGTTSTDEIIFSNKPNSLCTSFGKYKIGQSYNGKFGLAYKLHGLDTSNSNAFARAVVLHSHSCVPSEEVNYPICLSWGCPTVAPSFLQKLQTYIDKSARPILLEIRK